MLDEALASVEAAASLKELQDVRVRYLGKKGELTRRLKALGELPPEERRAAGKAINDLKASVESAIDARRRTLERVALGSSWRASAST